MKKDKWYLIISLAIVILSGAIIYNIQSRQPLPHNHPPVPDSQSQMSAALVNQISQLKKQLETDPGNFGILVNLGNNYYDLNNPAESVKYYEMALRIRPDVPEVLVDCGAMYRQLGDIDKALAMFTRATQLAPDLPQAFYNLGAVLYSEKDDPAAAVEVWQGFLDNNPGIQSEMKDFFQEKINQASQTDR
jgi:cytochrome c-type biogenesis protein CcmH/NrfG